MGIMKKISVIIMAVVMCAVSAGLVSCMKIDMRSEKKSGTCGKSITWELDDEGTLTISGTGDMQIEPYEMTGKKLWFGKKSSIKKVVIDNGVTSISDYAFDDCQVLTEIIIPDSVESIGNCAFYCCTELKKINIPETTSYFGFNSFSGTGWLSEKIEKNPLVVLNNVLIEGKNCSGDVTIPYGVTSIAGWAFRQYESQCENLISVTIPDGVINIGDSAFENCKYLEKINIPDSVKTIEKEAFCNCWSLREIILPESVASIGAWALADCGCLERITVLNPSLDIHSIFEDMLLNKGRLKIVGYENSPAQEFAEKYGYNFEAL